MQVHAREPQRTEPREMRARLRALVMPVWGGGGALTAPGDAAAELRGGLELLWERAADALYTADVAAAERALRGVVLRVAEARARPGTRVDAAVTAAGHRATLVLLVVALARDAPRLGEAGVRRGGAGGKKVSALLSRRIAAALGTGCRDGVFVAAWAFYAGVWKGAPRRTGLAGNTKADALKEWERRLVFELGCVAESGHAGAQALLGSLLCGVGGAARRARNVTINRAQGSAWLRAAAAQGYYLALDHFERVMVDSTAVRVPEGNSAATQKSSGALAAASAPLSVAKPALVSSAHSDGAIAPITCARYYQFVSNAAHLGVADATLRKARIVLQGVGRVRDESEAQRYINEAAVLNVPSAVSAVHAEAVRANMQIVNMLSRELSGVPKDEQLRSRQTDAHAQVERNRKVIATCEAQMRHWRNHGRELNKVLFLFRLFNLHGRVSMSLSEAILTFIEEREDAGWEPTSFSR